MDAMDAGIEKEKVKQLERIADGLAELNNTLGELLIPAEQLGECVGYVPPAPHQKEGYYVLRISGTVYNN